MPRLAVLGAPLRYTRSPDLHRAGLAALGLTGDSRALRTPVAELGARLVSLVEEGVTGVNLTHPLKEAAMSHLKRVSPEAAKARSVNTIGWSAEGAWGDSTDGPGFLDWLRHLGRDPARERVLLFGAGGAARSITLALEGAGAEPVRVAVRSESTAARRQAWEQIQSARVELAGEAAIDRALAEWATVVVNATPLLGPPGPRDARTLPGGRLVLDLVYGETPTAWVSAARERGLDAQDGLGLLVFQARRSLSLWFGREVPIEPLMSAVGLAR
ncbi:MAG: shikimate dehydrogenase family protein [Candidatus Eiseniibacteriota bacterium]